MQLIVLFACCLSLVFSADPGFVQWPAQWHANVFVADATLIQSIKSFIPITGSGNYYYDSTASSVVFTLLSPTTGRNIREVIGNDSVDIIDGPTQTCTPKSPKSSSRYQILPPDFLSQGKFSFVAIEYYLRDGVFYETYHWSGRYPTLSLTTIDYWHTVETNAPYRLSWGSIAIGDPVVIEFSSVMAGLDDVPNINYLFGTPSSCTNSSESVREKEAPSGVPPLKQRVSTSTGNAWPLQWHANSYYTGNNFGLQSVIGEPTTVPISLIGQYYYDWQNLRECNVWTDAVSGVRTKTLISNGTFYLVTMATNSCLIVPTGPVNGPLKNEWPTGLSYVDDELVLPPLDPQPASYAWTQHFYFDAFNVGPEHSFHYWQTYDTQVPVQFQGPVLEFPPYGQSMMTWSQFEQGLSGVDLEDIFSLPPVCKKIVPAEKGIALSPLIQMQIALNKMHSNF